MKPEKEELLRDLLASPDRRAATLAAGGRMLRWRRHWRTARQVATVICVLAAAATWLRVHKPPPQTAQLPPAAMAMTKTAQPLQTLTDDELLALFPDTPVALATLPDGTKRLLFLRPEDEAKYVIHL